MIMKNVYTVAQVNAYIKNMFSQDFLLAAIQVKGEISNCKYHSSGHIYFTLKDAGGAIACVMFAGNRATGLKFRLEEGQQVVVTGNVDVYERDGKYQLYAKTIKPDGEGDLFLRFEQLKKELEEMGMFAPEYKQPIPQYIKTLGVVTAPTGAAVQDIIQISTRRNPYVQIILYPAIVQGDQAPESIVNGIHALENFGVDVMIVGRGGGSMEDLWAFNERIVAQAVFDCSVPVISAVGHETDTTIIDYVSDLRAPTPSAAAELAVFEYALIKERLMQSRKKLEERMGQHIQRKRKDLEVLQWKLTKASPAHKLNEQRNRAIMLEEALERAMKHRIDKARNELALYIAELKGLSPIEKLNQGYSYTADEKGNTLQSVNQIRSGECIKVYVKDGSVDAKVLQIHGSEIHSKG